MEKLNYGLDLWNGFDNLLNYKAFNNFNDQYDVIENENEFIVEFNLAGIPKANISLGIDNGLLTMSAERIEKEVKYNYKNSYYGKISKSFKLPDNVNSNNITSKYEDGLLIISIPKKNKTIKKSITIK